MALMAPKNFLLPVFKVSFCIAWKSFIWSELLFLQSIKSWGAVIKLKNNRLEENINILKVNFIFYKHRIVPNIMKKPFQKIEMVS